MGNQPERNETTVPMLLPHIPEQPETALATRTRPSLSEMKKEAKQLYVIAFPLILAGLLTYGRTCISTVFLGRLGKDALAGGSLALGFANMTGYSFITGLAMGMDAICSQAIGARQWHLVGHTLQRTTLILGLFCLPISLLWINAHPILVLLRQDPATAALAATYLRFCLPDLLIFSILSTLRIYLRTQKITRPLTIGAGVSLALHAPLNYLIVEKLDLGIGGVAACVVLTNLNQLLTIFAYLYMTGLHSRTWGEGWSMECFRQWWSILRLAIPNCFSVCLEWWWYELMIILSGTLSNDMDAVATMGILIQATSLIYIFPSSLASAVSTRVGNELGSGNPLRARWSAAVALCCAIFKSIGALVFALGMRNVWGQIFSTDAPVLELTAAVMPWLGLCELGNCPQTTLCGVLRGSARPKVGARINLGAFYGVGLPVAMAMGFLMDQGLMGLWMDLFAAQAACSFMMSVALMKTNWEEEAERAKKLIGGDGEAAEDDDSQVADDDDSEYLEVPPPPFVKPPEEV